MGLLGSIPPVEVSLMGGTGGCMLGGSEDDLCRPTRSKGPGFQLLDAEDWPIPPRPDNWPEKERQRDRRVIKMRRETESVHCTLPKPASTLKVRPFPSECNWKQQLMGERECAECRGWGLRWGEVGNTAGCFSSALLAALQTATNVIKDRLWWTSHKSAGL